MESCGMDNEADKDIEEPAAPSTIRKMRKIVRAIQVAAGIIVLAGMAVFVLVHRSSNMDWYVSPPIDAQGRRVHVLLPIGWKFGQNGLPGEAWSRDVSPNELQTLILELDSKPQKTGIVQDWLKKLRLVSSDEAKGLIYLQVDSNVCDPWNRLLGERYYADRKVHSQSLKGSIPLSWAHRAIPIRGTDKEALIIFLVEKPRQERGSLAEKLCSSMYVE
jgi:hypothetical protein